MSNSFVVKFDGLEADQNVLDLRRFGEAMVGLDKVANTGLVAIAEYRLPKKGERFGLRIRASEPKEGSFEIVAEFAPGIIASVLPLVPEALANGTAEVVWRWISWVLNMAGGRMKEADPHFEKLLELTREIHKGRADSEEANRQFLLSVLDRVRPATKELVSPIGLSAETLTISSSEYEEADIATTEIDVPMADAIRAKERLTVGDMEQIRVRVDGLIHHNKQLKVEYPDASGKFITAQVRDPAFLEADNVYTDAVSRKSYLDVSAKPSRKSDGTLHALYILDARTVSSGDNPQEGTDR